MLSCSLATVYHGRGAAYGTPFVEPPLAQLSAPGLQPLSQAHVLALQSAVRVQAGCAIVGNCERVRYCEMRLRARADTDSVAAARLDNQIFLLPITTRDQIREKGFACAGEKHECTSTPLAV